jgi:hypothetical protein
MRDLRQYIAFLLLLVIGLVTTPKELIHEFAGHEDTHCHPSDVAAVENAHHHCSLLNFTCQPFTPQDQIEWSPPLTFPGIFSAGSPSAEFLNRPLLPDLRAPPLS